MEELKQFEELMEQYNLEYTEAGTQEERDAVETKYEPLLAAEEVSTEARLEEAFNLEQLEIQAAEEQFNADLAAKEQEDLKALEEEQEEDSDIKIFIEDLNHSQEDLLDNMRLIRKAFVEKVIVDYGKSLGLNVKMSLRKKDNIILILEYYL